jgi:DNA-binding MarR family transcriptional regulator
VSYEATRWAWDVVHERNDISVTRRIVLLALADAHNKETGQCNPSLNTLVKKTGCHRTTIPESIRDLEKLGLVEVSRAFGASSHYVLVGLETGTENHTSSENRTGTENRQEPVRKTVLNPIKEPGIEIEIPPKPPKREASELFARFWAAYPKKLSKGQAERTFAQLKPNEQLLAEILLGLQRAMTSDTRFTGEKRYTPNASTWLNAKGWQDEHDQEIPKPATSAAYGQTQRNGQQPRNGAHHATHQRPDNSAPGKVARAIAERDAARQPAGPGVPPDDFIELGSGDYWAVAY